MCMCVNESWCRYEGSCVSGWTHLDAMVLVWGHCQAMNRFHLETKRQFQTSPTMSKTSDFSSDSKSSRISDKKSHQNENKKRTNKNHNRNCSNEVLLKDHRISNAAGSGASDGSEEPLVSEIKTRSQRRNECDCLDETCDGCHFPCKQCASPKCGQECRVNRKWSYEEIFIEGITWPK